MVHATLQRIDVQHLVDRWARSASERLGGQCSPMLEEFDFGFVAWVAPPPGASLEPDANPCHVIDRVSGKIIPWGSIPAAMVADAYRRGRPPQGPPPVTADPVAMIRRSAALGLGPTIASHLMLPSERVLHIAYGAKGDQGLDHHALVRDWLAAVPRNHLTRGAERHAELLVMSDALHAHDAATGRPTTLDEARQLFANAVRYEVLTVTPAGGGQPAPSCFSCHSAEVHFGVARAGVASFLAERQGDEGLTYIGTGRPELPAEVRAALTDVQYTPAFAPEDPARRLLFGPLPGDPAPDVPARWMIAERYEHLAYAGSAPGQAHRRDPFSLTPRVVGDLYRAVAPYTARLGAQVIYPIGRTGPESVIVGDEHGRVFVIDQAGEWFAGNTIDEAVVALLLGRALPRQRDDGSW